MPPESLRPAVVVTVALLITLACFVVDDDVIQGVALGCCILGVRTDIEVETRTVLQEHV